MAFTGATHADWSQPHETTCRSATCSHTRLRLGFKLICSRRVDEGEQSVANTSWSVASSVLKSKLLNMCFQKVNNEIRIFIYLAFLFCQTFRTSATATRWWTGSGWRCRPTLCAPWAEQNRQWSPTKVAKYFVTLQAILKSCYGYFLGYFKSCCGYILGNFWENLWYLLLHLYTLLQFAFWCNSDFIGEPSALYTMHGNVEKVPCFINTVGMTGDRRQLDAAKTFKVYWVT